MEKINENIQTIKGIPYEINLGHSLILVLFIIKIENIAEEYP